MCRCVERVVKVTVVGKKPIVQVRETSDLILSTYVIVNCSITTTFVVTDGNYYPIVLTFAFSFRS